MMEEPAENGGSEEEGKGRGISTLQRGEGFDDARNTISQKARVGESYHQQQVKGSDAVAATESKILTTSSLIFFQ
ncbi:hypothetical protein IMY05_005G0066500 [Salix suchowensis]|nr:hypothetical protein IMY05_005G0066500 [Salix suchowensis]